MRKISLIAVILCSLLAFAVTPTFADTAIYTFTVAELEAATYASPIDIVFNGTVNSFTIDLSDSGGFSYDSTNMTIIAWNSADNETAMFWKCFDSSGLVTTGGNFNFTSEEYAFVEGAGDTFSGEFLNITFYADEPTGTGESVWVNGTEMYNAWSFDDTTFTEVYVFVEGSGSVFENNTATISVTLTDSDYVTYQNTELILSLIPTIVTLVVVGMLFKKIENMVK